MASEHLQFLRSLPRFKRFIDAELDAIAACIGPTKPIASGENLFDRGDPSDGAYIIKGGLLNVVIPLDETRSRRVARLGPGLMVGELCLIKSETRSLRVIAAEPSEVLCINKEKFAALKASGDVSAYKLIHNITLTVCDRLRSTNLQIQDFGTDKSAGTTEDKVEQKKKNAWGQLVALFTR